MCYQNCKYELKSPPDRTGDCRFSGTRSFRELPEDADCVMEQYNEMMSRIEGDAWLRAMGVA